MEDSGIDSGDHNGDPTCKPAVRKYCNFFKFIFISLDRDLNYY